MATVPLPHQFAVGEAVTSVNLNSYYSGISFLQNPPIFKSLTNTTQSIGTSFTTVNWNASVYDTYSGHSNVTNNSQYIAQVAGYYFIYSIVPIGATTTAALVVAVAVNGTQVPGSATSSAPTPGALAVTSGIGATTVFLNVGDIVTIQALATVATNTLISGTPFTPSFEVVWMHV